MSYQKSFLKWPGGKFRVLPQLLPVLPRGRRLIEPFGGAATVALNSGFDEALVADLNLDLVLTLKVARKEPEQLIAACEQLFVKKHNTERAYYRLREEFNELDPAKPAWLRKTALFVYLNKHAFNGLVRYNAKGGFNAPFGYYDKPALPAEEIRAFARKAKRFKFVQQDFAKTMQEARPGDVVYCDPPYVPLNATANFTGFTAGGFGIDEQRRLAAEAMRLAERGIPCVVSNHDTPVTREIYRGAKSWLSFSVHRSISCDAATRGGAAELLAVFAPVSAAQAA